MAETKITPIVTSTNDATVVDGIIAKLAAAKTMMGEPDKDGLRKDLVATALKKANSELADLFERYRPRRQSK